jgi:hypothetical protein
MSTEVLSQTLGAGGKATFGSGTQFLIVQAANPITVVAKSIGNSNKNRVFSNVPAGFKFTADDTLGGFDTLEVTSASAQTVILAVGTDDVSYSNNVTISGTAQTTEVPASALANNAPVAAATAAQTAIVPVNGARKRVTLTVDPASAMVPGTAFFRSAGGSQNLIPVQAGLSYPFAGTYGVDLRNDSGATINIYIAEES